VFPEGESGPNCVPGLEFAVVVALPAARRFEVERVAVFAEEAGRVERRVKDSFCEEKG